MQFPEERFLYIRNGFSTTAGGPIVEERKDRLCPSRAGACPPIGISDVSPGYERHNTGFKISLLSSVRIMLQHSNTPAREAAAHGLEQSHFQSSR